MIQSKHSDALKKSDKDNNVGKIVKQTLLIIALTSIFGGNVFADNNSDTPTVSKSTTSQARKATWVVTATIPCLPTSPCFTVKDTTTKLMNAIDKASSQTQAIADITTIASPQFDFRLMTKYALGNNWKLATKQQQAQLVGLFTQLLQFTYSMALSKFEGAQITLTDSTTNPTNNPNNFTAAVVSQVLLPNNNATTKNQAVKVEYDLVSYNKQPWRAYDIKIEDTSLVTTYRNQFNDVVQNQKIAGLIKQLQTKVDSLSTKNVTQN